MPPSETTLSGRHARLVTRCATERATAVASMASVMEQVARADRRLQTAQRWARSPIGIAAGVALLVAAARSRSRLLRRAGALLGVLSTGLKARSIARSLREFGADREAGR